MKLINWLLARCGVRKNKATSVSEGASVFSSANSVTGNEGDIKGAAVDRTYREIDEEYQLAKKSNNTKRMKELSIEAGISFSNFTAHKKELYAKTKGAAVVCFESNKQYYVKFNSGEVFVISSMGLLSLLNNQIKFSGSTYKKELVSHL